jgi:hypothetical protein
MDHADKTKWDLQRGQAVAYTTLLDSVYCYDSTSSTDDCNNERSTVSVQICGKRVPDIITDPLLLVVGMRTSQIVFCFRMYFCNKSR